MTELTDLFFPGGLEGRESSGRVRLDPWVRKTPLEEGMATHSSILAWGTRMNRGASWL